jgi:acyl carrier protein
MSPVRPHLAAALATVAPEADLDAVDAALPLREQLDIDSMDFLRLLGALHTRLGVDIPEADYARCATLAGLELYLEARLAANPAR